MALPAADTENAVPSSMDDVSPAAAAPPGAAIRTVTVRAAGLEVVNCQVSGASVAPCVETTLPTLADITVAAGSGCAGENVIVRASADRAEVPATAVPFADSSNVKPALIGAENVTDGFDVSGKPMESAAGTWAATVSGGTDVTKSTSTR